MPKREPDTFAALKTRTQETLIEFLDADLDLAFTFLEIARNETDHHEATIDKVRTALESIHRFQSRVEDPEARERIQNRAAKLEAELEKVAGR
jgi:hypothetical protein